jgi:predicted RNA-binding Zn ribbon-like protein
MDQAMLDMPKLVGGALCLDFVNTVDPRHAVDRHDYLNDYGALVAWAFHAGVVEESEARRLLNRAKRKPDEGRNVWQRAIRLRESIYRVFSDVAEQRPAQAHALACLNRELRDAMANTTIVASPKALLWRWDEVRSRLDPVLWPIVRSAADLLVEGPLDRIRECPGEGNCGWLFVDLSKNAKRRWCDMSSCGNRAKARRYYARIRGGAV